MKKNSTARENLENEIDCAIEDGAKAFVRQGRALTAICDRKLYRDAGFKNLESYTLSRWGFKRIWAYQLMNAARVYGYLEEAGFSAQELPHSESPLRAMKNLTPVQCVELWGLALKRSPKPTQALITELIPELG